MLPPRLHQAICQPLVCQVGHSRVVWHPAEPDASWTSLVTMITAAECHPPPKASQCTLRQQQCCHWRNGPVGFDPANTNKKKAR